MSGGFSGGTGGGGEADPVTSAGNAKEGADVSEPGNEVDRAMQDLFVAMGAVAQAGREHGLDDTATIDLPAETLDRADEIFQSLKPE